MMLLDSGSCALHPSCLPHFSQSIYIAPVCISSWPSPCKGQIQKTHFPGSSAAVSLQQLVPGYVQVGWPHPNPVIMPATFSWMECFLLFFLTLFQHGEIVWLVFLHPEVPSEHLSLGCSAALALFSVDIFNSSDGEDVSGELEAILATVEPQKSIRFIWFSSHTEYFWLF